MCDRCGSLSGTGIVKLCLTRSGCEKIGSLCGRLWGSLGCDRGEIVRSDDGKSAIVLLLSTGDAAHGAIAIANIWIIPQVIMHPITAKSH